MAWQQVEFALAAERTGLAEATLEALGASAVTWSQAAGAQAVLEPAPGQTQLWDQVNGSALFADDVDTAAVEAALVEALGERPRRLVTACGWCRMAMSRLIQTRSTSGLIQAWRLAPAPIRPPRYAYKRSPPSRPRGLS
jgi:ribosomal protein L11 methylase PrmA